MKRHLSEYVEALGPCTSRSVWWAYYQNLGPLYDLEIELMLDVDSNVAGALFYKNRFGSPMRISFQEFFENLKPSEREKFLFHLDLFLS